MNQHRKHRPPMKRPPKINSIYAGIVKDRKDVEAILKEALPARARIEGAWVTDYWDQAGSQKRYHNEGVVYWSLDRVMYGATVHRMIVSGDTLPWEVTVFRPRLQLDLENAQMAADAGLTQGAYLVQLAGRLVELERRWWAGEDEAWDKLPEITETLGHSNIKPPREN